MSSINTGSSKNAKPALKQRLKTILLLLLPALAITLNGQADRPLKREFRGVWVATVLNLDYPKSPSTSPTAHQEEWRNLLDKLKATGFNAVVAQVRPAADAFYRSEYAPWSSYLTGKQGLPPSPEYDVLKFMIDEAHKRGMDFHAWLNPYRVSMNLDTALLSPNQVFYQHRDWVVPYGNRYYLNPGLPQVQQHLSAVAAEIASRYDIDGIHFDDYFYPYPVAGAPFPDSLTFEQYGKAQFDTITDWRRYNVNRLIQLGRSNPDIDGGIFFRAASTLYGDLGVRDSLQAAFATPALLPEHQYEEAPVPAAPRLKKAKARRDGTLLKWKFGKGDRKNRPYYYVVYRFKGNQPVNLGQPEHILHLTHFGTDKRRYKFTDTTTAPGHTYTYVVTGISRTHRESPPSEKAEAKR